MKSNSTRRVLRGEGAGRFKGTTPGVGIVAAGDQSSFYLAHLAYELSIQIIATNVFIHNHSIIHSFYFHECAAVFGAEFLRISGIPRSIAHEHIAAGSEDSALLQTVAFIF